MDQPPTPSSRPQPGPGPTRPVVPVMPDLPTLPPAAPGMGVGDIYYILFRHKWKIILCGLAGLAAAAAAYFLHSPPYHSGAKLFVRYVVTESRSPDPTGDMTNTKSPDMRGETLMNAEREILTSFDLARKVAATIGPERILGEPGEGDPLTNAAAVINRGLMVEAPRLSSVIQLSFQHSDATVVQPVLTEIINQYLKTHVEIHRAVGIIGDFLTQETDQLRTRLARTEEELRRAKNRAGVVTIEDSKREFAAERARLRDEIMRTQAELAERIASLEALGQPAPGEEPEAIAAPPPEKLEAYRGALARVEQLRQREQELLVQLTPENTRVKDLRSQLTEADNTRLQLEAEFPALARTAPAPVGAPTPAGSLDPAAVSIRINALQARLKVLEAQLEQVRTQATNVDAAEGAISELLRRKELEEANYRYYAARLEQSRINEALGSGKVSNISLIQEPTPPAPERKKLLKLIASIAAAGFAVGLGWALAIELFFDHTVRRPIDVERMLGLPLFLAIPALKRRRKFFRGRSSPRAPATTPAETPANGAALVATAAEETRLADAPLLHSFYETLRDRLINYFESRNLTHKPKLVAVTGLDRGAGVTTAAAGLASCLSETGEGNVLLVDMTAGQGSAQQFFRGRKVCGLDEILSTRDSAQVQDNLFVVVEEPGRGDRLSRILPQRFNKLVPKLKASNFDYIIFDMPPVSQISITPRLAGFMDMVLIVIESEKTNRELVQRATALLAQSKAHVGAILNKTHNYVPKRLHHDTLEHF